MYGYFSIRTPSNYPGNGSSCFQDLFNQRLNYRYRILKHLGQGGFVLADLNSSYPVCRKNTSDSESQTAFFFSSPLPAAVDTLSVQVDPLFAEEMAAIKSLPLVRQLLIVGTGVAICSVAIACLVFCLGTILFALSIPPRSSVTSLTNEQSASNPF